MTDFSSEITIIDYGRGNLFSLSRAIEQIGLNFTISNDPDQIVKAEHLMLPGVGAFGDAMQALQQHDLVEAIHVGAKKGALMTGICLGMQLFAQKSEEFGVHKGLGLIPGDVVALPKGEERIPNVGWRPLELNPDHTGQFEIKNQIQTYFVHSYGLIDDQSDNVVATTYVNNQKFIAIYNYQNIAGCQFHPEKSSRDGLKILSNILKRDK